ncbi:MAG: VWA domain-containing protein [Fuerstiella sp.]
MLQFFLNPIMLAGLAGVSLPVLAHLLSRRKYDIVPWGAMQFLNPSRKTRRKLKLEELLLLLIRILAVALLALAASRPWINSGFLTGYRSAGSRDIVFVIDGSNSMSRSDGLTSLHQKALRRAEEFLDTLQPGDTVAVIDARDRPVRIVETPLQDLALIRERLKEIPPPAGAADLQRACEEAVGILGRCSNGAREVIVLTDRQRCGWSPGQESSWKRFDDVLRFPSVRPALWVVDISAGLGAIRQNVSLGQIDMSRDLTVPGFPVGFHVAVTNAGQESTDVSLQILVNGQRVAHLDEVVSVPAESEVTVSQTIRFSSLGTNLVTVRVALPEDALPADNESHAAVQVTSAVPVLLVEDSTSADRTQWNTFFAELALTNPENKSPWIRARTVRSTDLTPAALDGVAAVVLADVTSLPDGMDKALHQFAARGNGIFVTLGKRTSPDSFRRMYIDSGLLPTVQLKRVRTADPDAGTPVTVAPYSLEASWLNRFRERKAASLLQAAFTQWWLLDPVTATPLDNAPTKPDDGNQPAPVAEDRDVPATAAISTAASPAAPPVTVAQLISGDPLLLQASCGRGRVLLMTSNIDTSMNNLVGTPDYVPFLHEALFQMAASRVRRNVDFGQPLLTVLATAADRGDVAGTDQSLVFQTPDDRVRTAGVEDRDGELVATLPATRFPGVYHLKQLEPADGSAIDTFVVNYDHAEDNPAELTGDDRARLLANDRLTFVDSMDVLKEQMYGHESRSELWALLLWMFLAMLTLEVWMTRRLVTKGHADTPLQTSLLQDAAE